MVAAKDPPAPNLHPQIVRRSDSLFGGKRLTMQEIMAKLIERERSSACAAAVSCLRAQIVEAVVANAPPTQSKEVDQTQRTWHCGMCRRG